MIAFRTPDRCPAYPKALREKSYAAKGALTETEAAAYVGVTTLEFDRLRRSGILCEPIPCTKLWDRTELYRSVAQCRPQSSRRVG